MRALTIATGVSDKGTNAELLAQIKDHFEQHPDLKLNTRFLGLFNKSTCFTQRKGHAFPSSLMSAPFWRRSKHTSCQHRSTAANISTSNGWHLCVVLEGKQNKMISRSSESRDIYCMLYLWLLMGIIPIHCEDDGHGVINPTTFCKRNEDISNPTFTIKSVCPT